MRVDGYLRRYIGLKIGIRGLGMVVLMEPLAMWLEWPNPWHTFDAACTLAAVVWFLGAVYDHDYRVRNDPFPNRYDLAASCYLLSGIGWFGWAVMGWS